MKATSIWLENFENKQEKILNKDITVDVLIIGGGLTGLSTAYHLQNSNLKVCLVEKNEIGQGVSSKTTAKLTYLQENIYSKLTNIFSKDKAKLYLKSQLDALKLVENIIKTNNIDCDYQKIPSFIFTSNRKSIKKLKKEKNILEEFGITVKEHYKLPDNKNITYGISVQNTAIFHPLKYIIALKNIISKNIPIYEQTKVINIIRNNNFYICKTKDHLIKARYVVLAIHYPYFLFPFIMPLKCHLEKSYISAFKVLKDGEFSAINIDKDTLSIRYHKDDKNIYKIIVNNSHNIAFKNNDKENFNNMIRKKEIKPNYFWSNKDIITNDYLPFIGKIDKYNLLIATGYNTWGMTNGSLAGKILSDIILNKDNPYISLFNPLRKSNIAKIINLPINIYSNMKSYIGTKLNKNKHWYSKHIKITKIDNKDVGIYIDDKHIKHFVYLKCPHLKCNLIFNEQEKTWDCPCHGS